MDDNYELEELSNNESGLDSSSFSSGTSFSPRRSSNQNIDPEGKSEYKKLVDNKNYYKDQLKQNAAERKQLENDLKTNQEDNKNLGKDLDEKNKSLDSARNELKRLRDTPKGDRNDPAEKRLQDIKSRRNNINQAKQNVKNAEDEQKKAADAKKKSDEKIKENENALEKNKSKRKELEKDAKKATNYARKHPIEAAKMRASGAFKRALKKLGKLLVIKIVLPFVIILVALALLVEFIYEAFDKIDSAVTEAANVVEKTKNFLNGLGFQNSEDAFYEELENLQKEYGNSLNEPLLLSTLFYDEIQNNMDVDDIETKVVSDGENLLGWTTVYNWIRDKFEEANVTVGERRI